MTRNLLFEALEDLDTGPDGARLRFVLLRTDATHTYGSVRWPPAPSLSQLAALITPLLNGGQMEHVAVLLYGRRADLFVDETGRLKGLPRNDEATRLYRQFTLARNPSLDPEALPWIAGPAVLFERRVWF